MIYIIWWLWRWLWWWKWWRWLYLPSCVCIAKARHDPLKNYVLVPSTTTFWILVKKSQNYIFLKSHFVQERGRKLWWQAISEMPLKHETQGREMKSMLIPGLKKGPFKHWVFETSGKQPEQGEQNPAKTKSAYFRMLKLSWSNVGRRICEILMCM